MAAIRAARSLIAAREQIRAKKCRCDRRLPDRVKTRSQSALQIPSLGCRAYRIALFPSTELPSYVPFHVIARSLAHYRSAS